MQNASTTTRNASSQKAEAITAGSGSRALFVALLAVVAVILVIAAGYRLWNGAPNKAMAATNWNVPAKFDAARAFGYLERIVAFGPRPSGSPAMRDQQAFLKQFFETQGCEVEMQTFDHRHPETGERVEMVNVIARFQPDAKNRYLICAHYDTRPFPDSDRSDPKGVFVGANDGGS